MEEEDEEDDEEEEAWRMRWKRSTGAALDSCHPGVEGELAPGHVRRP